jgi:hypothetical protein
MIADGYRIFYQLKIFNEMWKSSSLTNIIL